MKDTIYWLRDNFPSNTVVRCSRIKNWGGIEYKKGKFYIKINCNVPYSFRFESLLHEWAHALVWCGRILINGAYRMLKYI